MAPSSATISLGFTAANVIQHSAVLCRDTVQVYEQLRESGLQYGPSFRLLRNIHVPDISA